MATRICLVGRRQLFRAGLKHILNNELFEVSLEVGELSAIGSAPADCRLYIVDKPQEISEFHADLAWLKANAPGARIVLLSDSMEANELASSFAAGVDGYLLANISPEALCKSLRLVMLGEKVFPSGLVAFLSERNWPAAQPAVNYGNDGFLSERETQIIAHLAGGLPNKVIADQLTITEATVKVHLKNILKKLGVTNRTQAAIWAISHGVTMATPAYEVRQ